MSSRAPAAAAPRGGGGTDHLRAKAAELERDFAGYKRRLAERRAQAAAEVAAGRADEEERCGPGDAAGRGRRYDEYVRRRDERLRQDWRARMERKEAEVKALWAQLELTGRAGAGAERAPGGDPTPTTTDGGAAAGNEVGNSVTCHTTPSCTFPVSRLFATTRCRLFLASPPP